MVVSVQVDAEWLKAKEDLFGTKRYRALPGLADVLITNVVLGQYSR